MMMIKKNFLQNKCTLYVLNLASIPKFWDLCIFIAFSHRFSSLFTLTKLFACIDKKLIFLLFYISTYLVQIQIQMHYALFLLMNRVLKIYPYLLFVYMTLLVIYNLDLDFNILAHTFSNNYLVIMEGSSDNPGPSDLGGKTTGGPHLEPGGNKDPQSHKNEQASGVKRKHDGDDLPDNRKKPSKSLKPTIDLDPCDCCATKPCSCGGPQLHGESVTINLETSVRNKCYDTDRLAGRRGNEVPCCKCGTKHFFYVCASCYCTYCYSCHSNHTPW